jgi:hypothetical protein
MEYSKISQACVSPFDTVDNSDIGILLTLLNEGDVISRTMPSNGIKVVSGKPWDPDQPAILVVQSSSLIHDKRVEVTVALSLIRASVPRGFLVKSEMHVACTGAAVEVWAQKDDFLITDFTPSGLIKVGYKRTSKSEKGIKINPKFKGKAGAAETEIELAELAKTRGVENEGSFEMYEAPLNAIPVTDQVVRWQIDSPRVENIVRDFLEGRMDLKAAGSWQQEEPFKIRVRARPRDRRIYRPNLSEYSSLWSIGLMAKLFAKGKLPPMGDVHIEIPVDRRLS